MLDINMPRILTCYIQLVNKKFVSLIGRFPRKVVLCKLTVARIWDITTRTGPRVSLFWARAMVRATSPHHGPNEGSVYGAGLLPLRHAYRRTCVRVRVAIWE